VFEAAGAAACIITDAWEGVDFFFETEKEILVARSGDEVREILGRLTVAEAREIGLAAYKRVLMEHTYAHRAAQLEEVLADRDNAKPVVV
jgi:spore maturation protein CgeB